MSRIKQKEESDTEVLEGTIENVSAADCYSSLFPTLAENPTRHTKKYMPTDAERRFVSEMVAMGAQFSYMASKLGISENVLKKTFAKELIEGGGDANMVVAASLFHAATQMRSVKAMEIWLRHRAGWKDYDKPVVDEEGSIKIQLVAPKGLEQL